MIRINIFKYDLFSGQLGARLATDATTVRRLVGDTLAVMVQTIATIIVGIVIAMAANWKLALIILVLAPLLGLQEFFQQKFHRGFSGDAKVIVSCLISLSRAFHYS